MNNGNTIKNSKYFDSNYVSGYTLASPKNSVSNLIEKENMDPFKEEVIWVFSDERLPGIEVHNRGRCTFNVYEYNEVVDCFTS